MEVQPSSALALMTVVRSEVDTTRPFRSVKDAIAVFGERLLSGEAHSQKTSAITPRPVYSVSTPKPIYAISAAKPLYSASSLPRYYSSSSSRFNQDGEDEVTILHSLKKMEAELEETRREVMLLKERESETELAVASINAELHRSMSKLAEIEAAGVPKAAKQSLTIEDQFAMIKGECWGEERTGFEYLPSLAEALSLGELEENFGGRRKPRLPKKKPTIPLIGDMFSNKKVSAVFDTRPRYGTLKTLS